MSRSVSRSTLHQLRALFAGGTAAGWTDGELLERVVAAGPARSEAGEAAFAALVDRHGPMVWGVCVRTLGRAHEAEDAFQATFLILARRAASVRGETLGRWLHGVALKVARRARRQAERSRSIPGGLATRAPADPAREAELGDLRAAVGEEIGRLRAEVRAAVELCHLQGLTHDEAARRLECSKRTVKSRLSAGRRRLRARLSRRGLGPALAGTATAVTREARAVVPSALARATVRTAMESATAGAGVFPASVAALATGVLRAMFLTKLSLAVVLGLAATGAAVHAFQDEPRTTADAAQRPNVKYAPQENRPQADVRPDQNRQSAQSQGDVHYYTAYPSDATHRDIRKLADEVHNLLVQGHVAEAQAAAARLSALARGWERAIGAETRANAANVRDRVNYGNDVVSYLPTRVSQASPATDSDQERRIRRLEALIERLLSDRDSRDAKELPATRR